MVSEGVLIDSLNGKLEGSLHVPNRKTHKIIIICHGRTSNKDNERILKSSQNYCSAGFAVLRFNFGGSGETQNLGKGYTE